MIKPWLKTSFPSLWQSSKKLTISGSDKPMQAIHLRNRSECHTNRIREQIQTSDLPSTKEGLHLGPHLFNGIQIGTAGRKVQYFHSLFLQDLQDSLYVVRAHIVHHNNVSGLKSRKQDLFQILDKTFPGCPALVRYKCLSPFRRMEEGTVVVCGVFNEA